MATERITLDMDSTSLHVARSAADLARMPLAEWVARAVRDRGIAEAAAHTAEQDQLHPDLMKEWAEEIEQRMFEDGGE
ncbi:hypothetical protein HH310_12270 [Actinoplanes sp. TBRC 11911]|uniref:hypothetical protein n=1 Tax=Actinoplanes sp. TBRC 11911 TaxID=2729386 RepID=UPI00145D63C2|nr:hypothetical protein [Actinoplanes sp. TBRC 11911]NMO51968.1 hypothetical protein [Actinoplanes sp. TBRC 11911]